MKKITLLGVMAVLCLHSSAQGFSTDIKTSSEPLYISSRIDENLPLGKFLDNPYEKYSLGSFNKKLLILCFWFTTCTDCIAQFPKENALQKVFNKSIQLILVTHEPEEKVKKFLRQWEQKNNTKLQLPVIVADTLLSRAFRHLFSPHYAWLFEDGTLAAQTTEDFVQEGTISVMLRQAALRNEYFEKLKAERMRNPIR